MQCTKERAAHQAGVEVHQLEVVMIYFWTRVAKDCRRIGERVGVEVPNEVSFASGSPFRRDMKRMEALAGFLSEVAKVVEGAKGAEDAKGAEGAEAAK